MIPRTAALEDEIQEVAGGIESMITGDIYSSSSSSTKTPTKMNNRTQDFGSPTIHPSMPNNQPKDHSSHELSTTRTPTTASATSTSFTSPSDASTAISTPANPNFSIPLTGSPSNRKQRPQPLNLESGGRGSVDAGRNSRENKGRVGIKEKVKARVAGKDS